MKKFIFYSSIFVILVLNANSQTAYIGTASGYVKVFDVASNTFKGSIAVGSESYSSPKFISGSQDGTRVYVSNNNDTTISVINTSTNTVIANIGVGYYQTGLIVSPDGNRVYVANYDANLQSRISVINTATNTVIAIIPLGQDAFGLAISPDGNRVYAANPLNSSLLFEINTIDNSIYRIDTIDSRQWPELLSISPDGQKIYISCWGATIDSVIVFNTVSSTVVAKIPTNGHPGPSVMSPNGDYLYVTNDNNFVNVINTTTNTISSSIPVGNDPLGISISPDGSKVYVVNSLDENISVINTATNTVSDTIHVQYGVVGFGNFISAYVPPPATLTQTNVSCFGSNNGTATVSSVNSGQPPYIYWWNTVPSQTTNIATGLAAGTYKVTIKDANYFICDTASVTITQPPILSLNISYASTICGVPVQLITSNNYAGSGTLSYNWHPLTGLNVNNIANPMASPISTTTYTVTLTTSDGCIANDTATVYVTPILVNAGNDQSLCYGSSTMLNATGGTNYFWSPSVSLNNAMIENPMATPATTTTYVVTVTDINGCSASDNITLTVNDPLSNFTLFPNASTQHLYNILNNASGIHPLSYLWSWGDGTFDTIAFPNHVYSTEGYYEICLTITDSLGCTNIYCDSSYLQKSSTSMIWVEVIPQIITGINQKELIGFIKIYPNPVCQNITVEAPQQATIEISNIEGQLIKTLQTTEDKTNVDISGLPGGLYIIRLNTEDGSVVRKFVKE